MTFVRHVRAFRGPGRSKTRVDEHNLRQLLARWVVVVRKQSLNGSTTSAIPRAFLLARRGGSPVQLNNINSDTNGFGFECCVYGGSTVPVAIRSYSLRPDREPHQQLGGAGQLFGAKAIDTKHRGIDCRICR